MARPWHRLTVVFAFFVGSCIATANGAGRPNFLLILADDLCWRDLGCMGNADVQTPNIDRLAADGMTLKGMFSPATTCSPSRHALYTGLFCVRSGAYPNHTMVDPATGSIFTYLKKAGYRVGLQAKQHVSPRAAFPYEYISKSADDQVSFREFITRDASEPWLAVFASHDPHGPWDRGPRTLYDSRKLTVPPYLHDNHVTRRQLADYYAEITKLDEQVGWLLDALTNTAQAEDTLVVFLSEQGSSFPYGGKWSVYDNGIRIAAFARWPGKIPAAISTEALIQYVDVPPTLLEAAGIDPSQVDTGCPDAVGNRGFDGQSFLQVLLGKSNHLRDYVFAQHTTVGINGYREPYPMRAVRDKRYKLIRNLTPGNTYHINGIHVGEPLASWQEDAKNNPHLAQRIEWLFHRPAEELYDLQTDPLETTNLAGQARLTDVQARLARELEAWMAQQGDDGLPTELAHITPAAKTGTCPTRCEPRAGAEPFRSERNENPLKSVEDTLPWTNALPAELSPHYFPFQHVAELRAIYCESVESHCAVACSAHRSS